MNILSKMKHYAPYFFIVILLILPAIILLYFIINRPQVTELTANTNSSAGSIKLQPTKAENKKEIICLDPGHGGKDVGASYRKINEAEINLKVAKKMKAILEGQDYIVYLTRESDLTIIKKDRAKYCNSIDADIMVSVHHNSYESDKTVDYGTALYYKDEDQALAGSIVDSICLKLGVKNQGIAKFDNSLLWVAKMPAAMSEGFFITNRDEYAKLTSSDSRLDDEAEAISEGIVGYFEHPDKVVSQISNSSLEIYRADLGD